MSGPKKLGRGLDTLIPRAVPTPIPSLEQDQGTMPEPPDQTDDSSDPESRITFLDPRAIRANRDQPREQFEDDAIDELAQSIRECGILQPLVVRPTGDGSYELIAGERRLRASRLLELPQVPCIVRLVEDQQLLELALIENIQRENLNPIELAKAYAALLEQHSWTQEQLADRLGKKRPSVANHLRLLELPAEVQKSLELRLLSTGHAKVILTAPADQQVALHERVVNEGLSVRALEAQLRGESAAPTIDEPTAKSPPAAPATPSGSTPTPKSPHVEEQEERLSRALGTKVEIREGRGRGKIVIDYYSAEDYERLIRQMLGRG